MGKNTLLYLLGERTSLKWQSFPPLHCTMCSLCANHPTAHLLPVHVRGIRSKECGRLNLYSLPELLIPTDWCGTLKFYYKTHLQTYSNIFTEPLNNTGIVHVCLRSSLAGRYILRKQFFKVCTVNVATLSWYCVEADRNSGGKCLHWRSDNALKPGGKKIAQNYKAVVLLRIEVLCEGEKCCCMPVLSFEIHGVVGPAYCFQSLDNMHSCRVADAVFTESFVK